MKKLLFAVFTFAFLSISLSSSAQDYLIAFAGTGASTIVSTVEVENLATGKIITLNGGDILHLTSVVGISQPEKINSSMRIYPNPMMDNSILALHPPIAGDAVITIYEMTGKTVLKIHIYLENGKQEFSLSGLKNGMYLINVTGNSFQYSGKILSSGQTDGNPGIEKVSITAESNIEKTSKKEFSEAQGTVDMYYTAGEGLKFKAISGIYSTVKTDIPAEDKTLSFNFIPCTDGDNNNYPVVEIGTQIWMAENLKTTKYNNNSDIPLVEDAGAWTGLSTPGYCWYNNDSATYNATYGVLYNWYTVNTGKLCPTGWHVPTDAEWKTLEMYLGMTHAEAEANEWRGTDQGTQLRNTTGWRGKTGTNTSGFTALPGGLRYFEGAFFTGLGDFGHWWSSTENDINLSWSRYMHYFDPGVSRFITFKSGGSSVRCVRDLPSLTTLNVTEISTTSAVSGGEITDDLGNPVIARGVCWSTHENPTIADELATNNSEVDSFTCLINGLTINTKYYVRAYATNSFGTGYGNEIMFATKGETGSVSDIDGNTYATIEIGTKTWMAENLKTTKYNDNTDIPLVEGDGTAWIGLSTPDYCWYNNDATANKATYGALYNWYTVNTGKLCPTGWHVPTDAEWKTLVMHLGMTQAEADAAGWRGTDQGTQLKNTSGWNSGGNGTNTSGFSALPGGFRADDGSFAGIGLFGFWWSSTEYGTGSAWSRDLGNYDGDVCRYFGSKRSGYSVRCLRD